MIYIDKNCLINFLSNTFQRNIFFHYVIIRYAIYAYEIH